MPFVALAGSLVFALLLGVRIDLHGNPAVAVAPTGVAGSQPARVAPALSGVAEQAEPAEVDRPRDGTKASSRPMRFAWAPVAGATGYRIELFLGEARVFGADTRGPQVSIPRKWSNDGSPQRLRPGEYRWFVWPTLAGKRATRAVVQAKLSISG